MAVERLVQKDEMDRKIVHIAPKAPLIRRERSCWIGTPAGEPTSPARGDAAHGEIVVSVEVPDDKAQKVRAAFAEFDGEQA